jgi:prepilin-type N-terminal cleavage/methylation domain-containing protein
VIRLFTSFYNLVSLGDSGHALYPNIFLYPIQTFCNIFSTITRINAKIQNLTTTRKLITHSQPILALQQIYMSILNLPKSKAFSMIEMSISITIIAIIMGLVMMVSKSAENARLLIIAGEYKAFQKSVKSFKDYFGGYPGDLPNAYDLLGTACGTDTSVESGGCNGDGNEMVNTSKESYKVAQHLYIAKLVSRAYSGSSASGTYDEKYINSLFRLGYYSPMIHSSVSYASGNQGSIATKHFIVYGAEPSDSGIPYDPLITPVEARRIDSKIDDGFAFEGMVQIRYNDATSCNGTDGNQIGTYDIDTDTRICNLLLYVD